MSPDQLVTVRDVLIPGGSVVAYVVYIGDISVSNPSTHQRAAELHEQLRATIAAAYSSSMTLDEARRYATSGGQELGNDLARFILQNIDGTYVAPRRGMPYTRREAELFAERHAGSYDATVIVFLLSQWKATP